MDPLTPRAATATPHQTIPAVARLGIEVTGPGAGSVTLRAPLEGNANHFGTMYAGVLWSLAEQEWSAAFPLDLEGADDSGRTVIATHAGYQLRPARP